MVYLCDILLAAEERHWKSLEETRIKMRNDKTKPTDSFKKLYRTAYLGSIERVIMLRALYLKAGVESERQDKLLEDIMSATLIMRMQELSVEEEDQGYDDEDTEEEGDDKEGVDEEGVDEEGVDEEGVDKEDDGGEDEQEGADREE
jgi:hypothetical protein